MNLELINELLQPMTILGCLIFGYVIKNYVSMDNKHIPLMLVVVGILFSITLYGYISVEETIIRGALSGLVSTGLHQVFHQYIKGNKEDDVI